METTHQVPQAEPSKAFPEKVPLFSPNQIAVGAFFGTLIAAGWLARQNFIAMGEPKKGKAALVGGIVITLALMALAMVLPENVPSAIFTVPQIVLALQLAKQHFEPRMITAERLGHGKVALVCIVSLVLVLSTLVGLVVALDVTGLMPVETIE